MDTSIDGIPQQFVDVLVNEFAYDPIRLPLTEDSAQILYNRKTLEKIWDGKQRAVNPYTRQPFDIRNVIPQTALKQQMRQYIIENNISSLDVIPADYTEALNIADMRNLLNELVIAGEQFFIASKSGDDKETEASSKVLWQKLNLIRLYCHYRAENREIFLSVKGYEYLLKAINPALYPLSFYYSSSHEHTREAGKEVAKIIDVIGLKNSDLESVPVENISALLEILAALVDRDDMKIQSMVIRIYVRIYENLIEYVLGGCPGTFHKLSYNHALHLLNQRHNASDLTNEDLYNVTALLAAPWNRNRCTNVQNYSDGVVKVVTICTCRLHDLHETSIRRAESQSQGNGKENEFDLEDQEKNIHMILEALDRGLFLIDSMVQKRTLQGLRIVKYVVRILKHVLEGCKFYRSSHLQFGLKITAFVCREEANLRVIHTNNFANVFRHFLESDIVNEYDPQVKLLLEDIVRALS